MRRWVGIDEAGYGPNIGPLVMTAVIAEDLSKPQLDRPFPDLWKDLSGKSARAGGDAGLLWIDDSKAVYRAGVGRDRLDAACSLAIEETYGVTPDSAEGLFRALDAGDLADCELMRWLAPGRDDWAWPRPDSARLIARLRPALPLSPPGGDWKIVHIRSVVVGPDGFNVSLARSGSKAKVHFEAFARLLGPLWREMCDGDSTSLSCDKHGGRHFYLEPLREVLADGSIEIGPEGPELSRYVVRGEGRALELSFMPRADADNGLVALASLVSKGVREMWMDAFNAYWKARIPELKPTAGYPLDARRFRRQIEAGAIELGLDPRLWWREK